MTKKVARISGFHRDPGDSFSDPKKETFAREWAKTGLLKQSCEAAGISVPTGHKWRGNDEMELRIRELRAGSETYVSVSVSYILNKLRLNAENAATAGKYRESNDALVAMSKIIATPNTAVGTNSGLSNETGDMTAEELAAEHERLFPRATLPEDTRTMVEDEDGTFVEEDQFAEEESMRDANGCLLNDVDAITWHKKRPLTEKYQELATPYVGGADE